jgi:hypothetical protein
LTTYLNTRRLTTSTPYTGVHRSGSMVGHRHFATEAEAQHYAATGKVAPHDPNRFALKGEQGGTR